MEVIIYQPVSFGGYYEYALQIFKALQEHPDIHSVELVVPKGAEISGRGVSKIFLSDRPSTKFKLFRRFQFIYRSLLNPFLFLFTVLIARRRSLILFNCYEQLTSPFWIFAFYICKRNNQFFVYVHDPEREHVTPFRWYSNYSMKLIMNLADRVLYHDYLPAKSYFPITPNKYVDVPHGLYPLAKPDPGTSASIASQTHGYQVMTLLGTIRSDKNYELAIRVLELLPGFKLLIAGCSPSSSYSSDRLRALAEQIGVNDRIIWMDKYLTENEMASVVEHSRIFLFLYSESFKSQSGILNIIANRNKQFVYSDYDSALAIVARKFGLGIPTGITNVEDVKNAILEAVNADSSENEKAWEDYKAHANWKRQVDILFELANEQYNQHATCS